jgi:hypothetical protein
MIDWNRMVWQYRINVGAEITRILLIFLMADEVAWAIKYHFPVWDDIAFGLTIGLMRLCWSIDYHTRIYRIDLE